MSKIDTFKIDDVIILYDDDELVKMDISMSGRWNQHVLLDGNEVQRLRDWLSSWLDGQ